MVFLYYKFKKEWSEDFKQLLVSKVVITTSYPIRVQGGYFKLDKENEKMEQMDTATALNNPYIEYDNDRMSIRHLTHLPEQEQDKVKKKIDELWNNAESLDVTQIKNIFSEWSKGNFNKEYENKMIEEVKKQDGKCILCEKPLKDYGNNAQPLVDGRCCDDCNRDKVLPARLQRQAVKDLDIAQTIPNPAGTYDDEVFFKGLGIQEIDRLKYFQLVRKYWQVKMETQNEDDFIAKEQMALLKLYWKKSFRASMDEAKVFTIEEDVVPLLLHTECNDGNFPFPSVFIDAKVQIKNRTYFGFHIGSYYTEKTSYKAILSVYTKLVKHNNEMVKIIVPDFIMLQKNTDEDLPFNAKDIYHNKIRNFCFSFCAFINEPEVAIVNHPVNPKNNERRIARGVMPLPEFRNVVIRGKLRIYVDKLAHAGAGGTHSPARYRYWVRGFYRHFFNKKRFAVLYALEDDDKKKAGLTFSEKHAGVLRRWVKPFIRGQGILIKQSWEVTE